VPRALTETLSGVWHKHRCTDSKKKRLRNFSGAAVVNTKELLWAWRWRSFFGFFLTVLWSFLAALACRRLPSASRRRSAGLRIRSLSRSSRVTRFAGKPALRRRARRWRIARLI